jgi:hypothetical protein
VVPDKNWVAVSLVRKVGNGNTTSFWNSKWVGENPLAVTFPRLFSLSNHKASMVSEFLVIEGNRRVWSFSWRRNLFQWEEDRVIALKNILEPVVLSLEEDRWWWLPDVDGVFSVKSAYRNLLEELEVEDEVEGVLAHVLNQLWESPAPSKVVAFSWQLLFDRIPTRSNLLFRGIPLLDSPWECLGCVGKVETSTHLFLHCPSVMLIWMEIFKWLGVMIVIPHSIPSLFEVFKASARNSKIRKGFLLIWHASIWSIWKARNSALFANGCFCPRKIIEDIKVLSWKWVLARLKVLPCLYYEWI